MLLLKTTNSEYTIFPIPTLPHPNIQCFQWKTANIRLSALVRKLQGEKMYLWNPKLPFQGIFCYKQESWKGSSLLYHSIHIICKPWKKFPTELKLGKHCPTGATGVLFLHGQNYITCQVFSVHFGQQKGQTQIQVIINNLAGH